jgi:hypothetical protein
MRGFWPRWKKEDDVDKLQEIESKLSALEVDRSREHYGPVYLDPLIPLVLELCQEVIKMRREFTREPRDWGRLHT